MKRHSAFFFSLLVSTSLLLAACGPRQAELPNNARVETAVAATVAAQNPDQGDVATAIPPTDAPPTEPFEPNATLPALDDAAEPSAETSADAAEPEATNTLAPPTEAPTEEPAAAGSTAADESEDAVDDDAEAQAVGGAGGTLNITWVDTGNVWFWSDDGRKATQLTDTGDVWQTSISDTGQYIAYISDWQTQQPELWVVDTTDGEAQQLLSYDALKALPDIDLRDITYIDITYLDWVPGTNTLAFSTGQGFEFGGLNNDDLYMIDIPDGELNTVFGTNEGGSIVFAPNGKQMAIVTSGDYEDKPGDISIANIDGSNLQQGLLAYKSVLTYSEYAFYAKPVWSADSQTVYVPIPPSDALGDGGPTNVWEIDVASGAALPAGQFDAAPFFGGELQISPELGKVAYMVEDAQDPNTRALHVANLDGSEDNVVSSGQIFFDSWAPGSENFIFSNNLSGNYEFSSLSGDVQAMSKSADETIGTFDWVNADQFLVTVGDYGNWELRLGTPDGEFETIATPTDDFFIFDFATLGN